MQFNQLHERSRRGNYAVLMGALVTVILGFAALGLDVSYMSLAETQAQHVADAASHAAYVEYRRTGVTANGADAADFVVGQNKVGNGFGSLDNVDFGLWDETTESFTVGVPINAAQASVSRSGGNTLDLFLAPLLGMDTHDVNASSITEGRTREIMIAQDVTGSFADDIDDARVGDLAFLQYLVDNPLPNDRFGMTAFVGGVPPTPWMPLTQIAGNEAALLGTVGTLEACNCFAPYSPATCISAGLGYNAQPWMTSCFDYGTNTAQGPGIQQAADELITFGDDTAFQAIILVSDGLPCCGAQTAPRAAAAVAAADYAWANGIHVWSVGYMNGGGSYAFLTTLTRGQGQAYLTPDPTQLEAIMLEIASSIPVVLVQ